MPGTGARRGHGNARNARRSPRPPFVVFYFLFLNLVSELILSERPARSPSALFALLVSAIIKHGDAFDDATTRYTHDARRTLTATLTRFTLTVDKSGEEKVKITQTEENSSSSWDLGSTRRRQTHPRPLAS